MKRFLLISLSVLAGTLLAAQDVTIDIDAPSEVAAGEQFRLIYTINSTDGKFTPPAFDQSFSVSGPQSSTSRNVQWINGEVTSVSTTTLIYFIVAGTPGTFRIPEAQYSTKKITISSRQATITVLSQGSVPSGQVNNGGTAARSGTQTDQGSGISLRLLLNTREVYVGQPVAATLKLFTRINLAGINDLKYPDFKGFLREDIETPAPRNLEQETIDGVRYGTAVLQRFLLYPQVPGELKVDQVSITALVQQRTSANDSFFNDPFFDNFFSGVTNVPRSVSTEQTVIKVKPLPAPQPADFYGAVGSFEMTSQFQKTDVAVNDAVTYTITLKGKGNLNLAGAPSINFPQGIEKYDPRVTVKSSGIASGTKTFEYLVIPRNPGKFDIPPVSYTVFDPQEQKYVTLRTKGFEINVTGDSTSTSTTAPLFTTGEQIRYLGQDIRFIHNADTRLKQRGYPVIRESFYWLGYVIIFVLAIAFILVSRETARRNADVAGMRTRKAAANARRRLAKVKSLLDSGKSEQVNDEITRAIWGYLGDKLSIPMSDLTREKCFIALENRGIGGETIRELDSILSAAEYSRYSPGSEGESPEGLYKRSVNLIAQLEDKLD